MIRSLVGTDNPTWQDRAACNGADPAIFLTSAAGNKKRAKAFCDVCPVRRKCLNWILLLEKKDGFSNGFYAGMTANERSKIRLCVYRDCLKTRNMDIGRFWCSEAHQIAYLADLQAIENRKKREANGNVEKEYYMKGSIRN